MPVAFSYNYIFPAPGLPNIVFVGTGQIVFTGASAITWTHN